LKRRRLNFSAKRIAVNEKIKRRDGTGLTPYPFGIAWGEQRNE
jgi:hypothetical protein